MWEDESLIVLFKEKENSCGMKQCSTNRMFSYRICNTDVPLTLTLRGVRETQENE